MGDERGEYILLLMLLLPEGELLGGSIGRGYWFGVMDAMAGGKEGEIPCALAEGGSVVLA